MSYGVGVQVPSPAPRRNKFRLFRFFIYHKKSVTCSTVPPFPHKSGAFAGAPNHHPPASLLLLFREKSRSIRLLVCKRTRDGSQSLPTFHDMAPSAQPKFPAATAFVGKSCKNTRTTSEQVSLVPIFYLP